MKKKLSLIIFLFLATAGLATVAYAQIAPSFQNNFGDYLVDDTPDEFGRVETVFNFNGCISRDFSLRQNIQNLFYPNIINPSIVCTSSRWWLFWDLFRSLGLILLFIYFVVAGISLVVNASDDEKRKKAMMSMLYILYGGLIFLWWTWILWEVLNIWALQWSEQFVDRLENRLFLQVLTLLKWLAFFAAIVFLVVYGYRIMAATDQEEKLKWAKTGILNVIISLVAIKVIDYLFYIATVPTFGTDAANFIIEVAKLLWYIIGATFMLSIFYLWFLLLTGRWEEDTITKVKNTAVTILLSALVIFLFLLIVYQVLQEIG